MRGPGDAKTAAMPIDLRCPICGTPVAAPAEGPLPAAFPFCSSRCRTRDLAAWAEGRYTVAGKDLQDLVDDPDLDRP